MLLEQQNKKRVVQARQEQDRCDKAAAAASTAAALSTAVATAAVTATMDAVGSAPEPPSASDCLGRASPAPQLPVLRVTATAATAVILAMVAMAPTLATATERPDRRERTSPRRRSYERSRRSRWRPLHQLITYTMRRDPGSMMRISSSTRM